MTVFCATGLATGAFDWQFDMRFDWILLASWAIILILVIGLPVAFLALVLPPLLGLVELFLLALILMAVIEPLASAALGRPFPGWASCLLLMAAFLMLERLIYGPWLNGVWRRDMRRMTGSFVTTASSDDVWAALLPDPETGAAFYWPGATFLPASTGSGADFVLSLPRRSGFKNTLAEITIETKEHPRHFRYRARPLAGSADPEQVIEVRIEPIEGSRTRVTYTEQNIDTPPGQRLFFYLHHGFRDTLASLRARVERRKDRTIQGSQMPSR